MKYGWLVKIGEKRKPHGNANQTRLYWVCRCKCGTVVDIYSYSVILGLTTSCGCKKKTHGLSKTETFRVWRHMHDRCNRKKNPAYKNYGGRGIKVCRRWDKFINFYNDMGPRPAGKSIDRIDCDGNYCPKNCKWSDYGEQARNRRNNNWVKYKGKYVLLTSIVKKYGLHQGSVWRKIYKGGHSIEQVIQYYQSKNSL